MMIAQWMRMSDYVDHQLLHHPTATGALGPMAQFLSDMPDFLEGIEESLQRALDALPIPTPGPPPDLKQFR
jgi:hypothetical protein